MRNPLRDEAAAFRLVLWTIAFLAPIVVASWIATWLGVAVFVAATVAVVVIVRRRRPPPTPAAPPRHAEVDDTPADRP